MKLFLERHNDEETSHIFNVFFKFLTLEKLFYIETYIFYKTRIKNEMSLYSPMQSYAVSNEAKWHHDFKRCIFAVFMRYQEKSNAMCEKSLKNIWRGGGGAAKGFTSFILLCNVYHRIGAETFKGAQAWDIRDWVIYIERSRLGRWLEEWTKKNYLCEVLGWYPPFCFFTDDWVCGKNIPRLLSMR
jgi:hypothetical protein